MPEPRYRFAHAVVGSKAYAISGLSAFDVQQPSAGVLEYDMATDTWASLGAASSIPTPRSDACATELGGKIYVAGGYGLDYEILDTIDVFDPATRRWSTLATRLAPARGDSRCIAIGDELIITGGNTARDPPPGVDCWDGPDPSPGESV